MPSRWWRGILKIECRIFCIGSHSGAAPYVYNRTMLRRRSEEKGSCASHIALSSTGSTILSPLFQLYPMISHLHYRAIVPFAHP